MARKRTVPEMGSSLADLLDGLGDVPAERIPLRPPPGTATEKDVLAARRTPERWLFELADGTLILKAPGFLQSAISVQVVSAVLGFLDKNDLGIGLGASAMYRLKPGLVRIPDFTFVSWERLPGGELPDVDIADGAPDLVVEVPRLGNTKREMDRKVREFFDAGVRLVWIIYHTEQTAEVYTTPTEMRRLQGSASLDGGEVLPGLTVPLRSLFVHLGSEEV
jgi:Uma2 family endonuclease